MKNRFNIFKTSEHLEQVRFIQWCKLNENRYKELGLIFAIPNGGTRGGTKLQKIINGRRLKEEGVRPGIPDLCLPIARKGFNAFYIEMKTKKTYPNRTQKRIHQLLQKYNNKVVVCHSCEDAIKETLLYLKEK